MKKFTLVLSFIFSIAITGLHAQTCNNALSVSISGVVNSGTCSTPCNGSATASATGATGYLWTPGNQTSATATGLCAGTYTAYAYDATFNCGSATVTITCPQSVKEDITVSSVQLFPNPSSEMLSVNFTYPNGGAVKEISVYNSVGERVLNENYSNKKFNGKIVISNLSSGVYLLELKDEKNSYKAKFVKE